jgi:ElaB/YqjD/DUF883 family membrane-anchored ribosome-binding protein
VILLVWVFYSAQDVLFGAELTHAYAAERGSRRISSVNASTPHKGRRSNEIAAAAFLLRNQLQEFEFMAQSQYGGRSDLSDKASEIKDIATDQFKKVADRAEGLADDAIDRLRDTGAGEVAGNLKGAVDKSVKDQPMATLALAAVLGFVLGALWKS